MDKYLLNEIFNRNKNKVEVLFGISNEDNNKEGSRNLYLVLPIKGKYLILWCWSDEPYSKKYTGNLHFNDMGIYSNVKEAYRKTFQQQTVTNVDKKIIFREKISCKIDIKENNNVNNKYKIGDITLSDIKNTKLFKGKTLLIKCMDMGNRGYHFEIETKYINISRLLG